MKCYNIECVNYDSSRIFNCIMPGNQKCHKLHKSSSLYEVLKVISENKVLYREQLKKENEDRLCHEVNNILLIHEVEKLKNIQQKLIERFKDEKINIK